MNQTLDVTARKETLEEAASRELNSSYAIVVDGELAYQHAAMLNMFRKGAEWQAKQSPWINARETPNPGTPLIVRFVGRHGIRYTTAVFTDNEEFLDNNGEGVNNITHYMPIPKLEEE